MPGKPIPTIDRPTPREFRRYVSRNEPVVIAGIGGHERAIERWSLEYLAERCGETDIPVFHYHAPFYRPDPGTPAKIEMMTMPDFLERSSKPPPYLFLGNVPLGLFPKLADDFTPPDLFGRPPFIEVAFINWEGSVTPLHFDLCEGLVTQLRGAKRVVIFPPGTKKLYPFPMFSNLAHFSQVDIENPDPERFPHFDPSDAWETRIEPGEMLYIPYLWWHQLHPLDGLNVTNGYFWVANPVKGLRYPLQSFRRAVMLAGDPEFRIARQRYENL